MLLTYMHPTLIFIMIDFFFPLKKTRDSIPDLKCTGSSFVLSVSVRKCTNTRFFTLKKRTVIMKMRVCVLVGACVCLCGYLSDFFEFQQWVAWMFQCVFYMYVCMYVCVCVYACICVCMYLCLYVCVYVYVYVCIYVCMYVCMYVCVYVCVCVCVCMYVCM